VLKLLLAVAMLALLFYGLALLVRRVTRAKGEVRYRPMPVRYLATWIVLSLLGLGYQHFSEYGSAALSMGMIAEVITTALFSSLLWGWVFWRLVGLYRVFPNL
jgi:Na+-driven multidrug efflux pump